MKTILLAGILGFALNQCSNKADADLLSDSLTIRSGTSYGMCVGYCDQQVELTGTQALFTAKSLRNPAEYPLKTCKNSLSKDEWTALAAKVNIEEFQEQPETLGCPDCADGGAEFVEIVQGKRHYRVTFEAGKTIPGFESLVEELRNRRTAFADCQ